MTTKTTKPEEDIDPIFNLRNAVLELWQIAAPHMSDKELKWFAQGEEMTLVALVNMHVTMERIACCVSEGADSGMHEDGSVSTLLYFFADSLKGIMALSFLGKAANDRLHYGRFLK